MKLKVENKGLGGIFEDIRKLIEETRQSVATAVNAGLTMLYWKIGRRIKLEIMKGERAEYGAGILQPLAAKLTLEFGRGFSQRNLASMIRFYDVYPDENIVVSLLRQLSWTHFIALIPLNDQLKLENNRGAL